MTEVVTFTWDGIKRGAVASQAVGVSVLVYGMAFGLIAKQAGLSIIESTLISAFVYSGSAQLAAVTTISEGDIAIATMAATILVMNARYVLFGAALHSWLSSISTARAYFSLFFLGDGNWMIAMSAYANGERDAGFVLGSGMPMFLGWLIGTVLGNFFGSVLPDPKLLGLDFMLAAFAAAMMVGMSKRRSDVLPILAGGTVAIFVAQVASFGWAIVAAGIAGGAAVAATYKNGSP